jgi:hypothetical protein
MMERRPWLCWSRLADSTQSHGRQLGLEPEFAGLHALYEGGPLLRRERQRRQVRTLGVTDKIVPVDLRYLDALAAAALGATLPIRWIDFIHFQAPELSARARTRTDQ